ncbi:unnamed protein product [Rotaria sp. Silwood2]|nr:unnamed protein product [Rotaria sp. Silwood2]CAF3389946.1 unnamed protein product [Rotaria sp. Silwood2]CAF4528272.1 unnamed protein product [Rotaria sp. Silwood2]
MSHRINIRTMNGKKHDPFLPTKFQRVRNRVAAILNAWTENRDSFSVDLVAHLHRVSAKQIHNEIYRHPSDFDEYFGIEDSTKSECTLEIYLKEIEQGIDSSLVVVANHVPFCLIPSEDTHMVVLKEYSR